MNVTAQCNYCVVWRCKSLKGKNIKNKKGWMVKKSSNPIINALFVSALTFYEKWIIFQKYFLKNYL